MSQYIKRMNGHRNICQIVDYEISEKPQKSLSQTIQEQLKAETNVYVISESYNLSLYDLYCTSQAEKTELSEEFLIETSF